MAVIKILEIGSYPPPNNGWSVRIKHLKEALEQEGNACKVLNLGKNRRIKNSEYIDVQNGFDYIKKLFLFNLKGYHTHIHMDANAVKGPILVFWALFISLFRFNRAAVTFHGGINQRYFPRKSSGKMYLIIYLNFLMAKVIICNSEPIKKKIIHFGPFLSQRKIHPIKAFSIQYLNYEKANLPQEMEEYIQKKKWVIFCYIVLRNGFFVETLIEFLKMRTPNTGVILTGIGEIEDEEIKGFYDQLCKFHKESIVYMAENLSHDEFMTILSQSSIYLRTPVSDGVSSSVLEALSLKIPVVASENQKRPQSVFTYKSDDADDLRERIDFVLNNIHSVKNSIETPTIENTVKTEIDLLKQIFT